MDVNREQVHHYQEQSGQSTLAEARDRLHLANNNSNTQRGASTTATASQGAQRTPHHKTHHKHHVSGTTGAQGSQAAGAAAAGSGAPPIRTSQGVPSSAGIIPGVPPSTFSASDRGRESREHATSDKHGHEHATSHRHEQGKSDKHGHEQATIDKYGLEHGQGLGDEHASAKKLTFIEKVKGEAKVLEGKLSKNKDRVEEGERMKGK